MPYDFASDGSRLDVGLEIILYLLSSWYVLLAELIFGTSVTALIDYFEAWNVCYILETLRE